MQKNMIVRMFLGVCLLVSTHVFADLEIIVKPSPDWGKISDRDVKTLCENITYHFEKHLRSENEINDSVNVYRTFRGYNFATLSKQKHLKRSPRLHLRKGKSISRHGDP